MLFKVVHGVFHIVRHVLPFNKRKLNKDQKTKMITSGPKIDQSVLLQTIKELDQQLQEAKRTTLEWKEQATMVLRYHANSQDTITLKEKLHTTEKERDIALSRLSEMNAVNSMNQFLQDRISYLEMELQESREYLNLVQSNLHDAYITIKSGVNHAIERNVQVGDQISTFQWQIQQAYNDREWFKERNAFLEQEVVNAQILISNLDLEKSKLQQRINELEEQLTSAVEEKNKFTAKVTRERVEMGKQLDSRMRQIERLEADFLEGRKVYHEATKRCEIEENRLRQEYERVASGTLPDGCEISTPSEKSLDKRITFSGSPIDSPTGTIEKVEKSDSTHLTPNILHCAKNPMSNHEERTKNNVPFDNNSKEEAEGCEDVDTNTEEEIKYEREMIAKDTEKTEKRTIRRRRSLRRTLFNVENQRTDESETSPRVIPPTKASIELKALTEEVDERKILVKPQEENSGVQEDVVARRRRSYEAHVARVSRNRKNQST